MLKVKDLLTMSKLVWALQDVANAKWAKVIEMYPQQIYVPTVDCKNAHMSQNEVTWE